MFHRTSTKLAALYLAIMMAISLFFSVNIYQLSVQELDRGLRRPTPILNRDSDLGLSPITRNQLLQEREDEYEMARRRVLNRLVAVNLIILVGGGFLSYYLALKTLKPIEEAHASLERFTADASHELRTPIAAMRTEIEVSLMNPKLTLKEAKNKLRSNLEELAKLTDLSEGLLRLARLENSMDSFHDISAQKLIQEAINKVLPLAEQKQILIHGPAKAIDKVHGDEASLVEALVIILDNAIKYSPEKTEIMVLEHKENDSIVLQVKDQGVGIKESDQAHVFERFYRADSARSRQTGGYGLGLAIAKNIIDLHNGAITIQSKENKGTMVTIQLPARVR